MPSGGDVVRTDGTTNYYFEISDPHDTNDLYLDSTAQTPTWRQYTPTAPRGTTTLDRPRVPQHRPPASPTSAPAPTTWRQASSSPPTPSWIPPTARTCTVREAHPPTGQLGPVPHVRFAPSGRIWSMPGNEPAHRSPEGMRPMTRNGRDRRSRVQGVLLAVAATALTLTAGAIATSTPALAAVQGPGDCIPYLNVISGGLADLGGPESVEVFNVTWAGSTKDWPSGSIRITATASLDGLPLGSVTGTAEGTSATTPIGGPVPVSTVGAIIRVDVSAYGPTGSTTGKVTCSKELPVAAEGPIATDGEPGTTPNGRPSGNPTPEISTWGTVPAWAFTDGLPSGTPSDTWTSPLVPVL